MIPWYSVKVRKVEKIKNGYNQDQEWIQPSATPDPGYHNYGKVIETQFIITKERQEISLFTAGDHKAAMNRRQSMTNTKHI